MSLYVGCWTLEFFPHYCDISNTLPVWLVPEKTPNPASWFWRIAPEIGMAFPVSGLMTLPLKVPVLVVNVSFMPFEPTTLLFAPIVKVLVTLCNRFPPCSTTWPSFHVNTEDPATRSEEHTSELQSRGQ